MESESLSRFETSNKKFTRFKVPYPAITICPESKIDATMIDLKKVFRIMKQNETLNENEWLNVESLYQVCNSRLFESIMNIENEAESVSNTRLIESLQNISSNFANLSENCMMASTRGCSTFLEAFDKVITSEGICYVSNMLNEADMYEKAMTQSLRYPRHDKNSTWTVYGYKDTTDLKAYPLRILGSGENAALKLRLKMRKKSINYACKGPANGFRLSISTPGVMPQPSQQKL